MGENEKQPFQLSFNRFLRVSFQGSRVTSDGGLILVREMDAAVLPPVPGERSASVAECDRL